MVHRKTDSSKYTINTKAHFASSIPAAFTSPKTTLFWDKTVLDVHMQYPGIHSRYTYWCLLVNRLYNKLLVIERDVSDFAPGEPNLWSQSGKQRIGFKRCCNECFPPTLLLTHRLSGMQHFTWLSQQKEDSSWTKNPQGVGKEAQSPPFQSLFSLWSAALLTFGHAVGMVSTEATHSALPNTCFKFISLKSGPKIRSVQTLGICAVLPRGFLYIMGGIS